MPALVVWPFDKNDPVFTLFGGKVELSFRGREAGGIRVAVFVAEQTNIDSASVHFIQVHVIGSAVAGRQILKQKYIEESPQKCVALDEVLDGAPFHLKFLLNVAAEETVDAH